MAEPAPSSSDAPTRRGVRVLLVTGTAGVGKSAVAKEIGELMRLDATGFAVIDLDAIAKCTVDPPVPGRFESALMVENLAAIWPNYRRYGVTHLVLARAVATRDEVDELRAAVPDARWTVCCLIAPADTVAERLARRERGISLPFLQRVARELADEMDAHEPGDFVVANPEGRDLTEVAGAVLARWRALDAAG